MYSVSFYQLPMHISFFSLCMPRTSFQPVSQLIEFAINTNPSTLVSHAGNLSLHLKTMPIRTSQYWFPQLFSVMARSGMASFSDSSLIATEITMHCGFHLFERGKSSRRRSRSEAQLNTTSSPILLIRFYQTRDHVMPNGTPSESGDRSDLRTGVII